MKLFDYISLTKPKILSLVVFTGATTLILEKSLLSKPLEFGLIILALLGSGGCANALNQYFERDIDSRLERTRYKRALPQGKIAPWKAFVFGSGIGVTAVVILLVFFNALSALLALATILFYSLFYTLWLKPRTYLNIVIGGAAGAMGPVIAWSAARGSLDLTPWILFLIIFFWTPPHFWALALCFKEDYEKVKLPMLPLIKGDKETARQILIYTSILFAFSLGLLLVKAGLLYLLVAIVSGLLFLWKAHRILQNHTKKEAWRLFGYSIIYLFILFISIIADVIWHKAL